MSSEENKLNQDMIQLSQEELTQDELRELINKTLKEGNFEAQFILVLNEWQRPGPSFEDEGEIEILYGEVEKILLDHVYNYPTTNEYTYAIIPKSRAVVLMLEERNDYNYHLEEHKTLYVFSYSTGWKSINLY